MVEPEVWRLEGHVPEVSVLVLDTGADTGVEWLCSSMGCISMVLTSCGRYWNGLGERAGESGMCTKVLVSMGVGAVGGLVGWGGNWCGVSGSSMPILTYHPNALQAIWQVCQDVDIFSSNRLLVWKYCQDLPYTIDNLSVEPTQCAGWVSRWS